MVTAGPGWSTYLGVAIVHVLHDAAGGEQAAAHVPGGAAAVLRVVVVGVVVHYGNQGLCRVQLSLPRAKNWALGKELFCRVPHSAKIYTR